MRRIDELFTAWPFLGSRRMTAMLVALDRRVQLEPMVHIATDLPDAVTAFTDYGIECVTRR